ncbi:MAG: ABC transporter permease [Gemmatimonadaceae bacterium]
MNPLRWATLRLRAVVARRSLEREMQEEMREHLARATERLIARGMSEADARIAARREFGNATVIEEEARDARGARWLDALAGDVRFALRYFGRHTATTAVIVAVLALGTGANVLIFSVFQAQFLRPPPAVPDDDALARIWTRERPAATAGWQPRRFTHPELVALAARREIFHDVAAWTEDEVVLGGEDSTGARGVAAQFVTPNYFRALGVTLAAGQGFRQYADDAPDVTAVISHAAAERRYGDAAAAVGRPILVNEVPVHVVGVAPPGFQGAQRGMGEPALWMPVSARAAVVRVPRRWLADEAALSLFARLAPDVSRDRAAALARQVVATALPDSAARVGMARTADVLEMHAPPPGSDTSEAVIAFTIMMTIGLLVLLVAWTNVSSLMVAAAVGRRHEIAVRLSLGASRLRLLRQLVTESTVLALAGGAVGLTLSWWALLWMAKTDTSGVDLAPDLGTFAFVLAIAVATGILFGLSPALHATRGGVARALRDAGTGTGGRARLQRGFVVAQIALSQPLLVVLGMLLTLVVADYQPLSPDMSRRVISVAFRPLVGTGAPGQRLEAVEPLVRRIAERPEVLAAVPEAEGFAVRRVVAPDRQAPTAGADSVPTIVSLEGAAPGWLTLLDVPIVLGRDVSLADTAAADHAVVIGSDLARTLWGDASPVGRRLASPALPGLGQDSVTMTVVGVYDATRRLPVTSWGGYSTRASMSSSMKRAFTAHGKQWRRDRILVRTRGPAEPLVPDLRRFVRAEAPSLPVSSMLTLAQANAQARRATLREAAMATVAGVLALSLASLGLYGVVSLAVRQRTREIGIRIAVGAHPMRVAQMFLASGVRVSLVALVLGLPLSVAGLKVGLSQGHVIAPQANPYLIGAVIALVLVAVASAATWVPARRAALVDPARTLRVE